MSTYKLYYFNFRGRSEICRLIFVAAGQKFEDICIEREQWPTYKPQMPLGQMPVLEFEGTKLPQSISIARFLAKQFQLAGKGNLEQARVDVVADTINDLLSAPEIDEENYSKNTFPHLFLAPTIVLALTPIYREQDETKKPELFKKFHSEELPKHLKNLDVLGKSYDNDGPFFVGNQLTWADLIVCVTLENTLGRDKNCLDNHPWLKQNRTEVEKQPRIAEYLKNRPKTPF